MMPPPVLAQRIGQGVGLLVVALFGGVVLTGLVLSLGTLIGVAIRAARWAAGGC